MSRAWITKLPDGRTNYLFHQSALGDFDLCLERARLGLVGDEDFAAKDLGSDATDAGTAVHHQADINVKLLIDGSQPHSLERSQDLAQEKFTELIAAAPDAKAFWKKRKERGARNFIDLAVTNWYQAILPRLDPLHAELFWGPYTLYEDDQRVVQLEGTIDYVDRRYGLMDWKTGSAHSWVGKEWEKERWALQPTIYTWGWHRYCLEHGLELPPVPQPWHFVVLLDNGAVMKLPLKRYPSDWVWLEAKVRSVVALIEQGTEGPWPLNDQHALCSPKWCPAWDQCKGKFVEAAWPRSAK